MSVTVRPHTKMMSAVLAAGVVAAAAPAWVPEAQEAAATVSTQAVQPAGLISDFLENVGWTVNGIGSSIAIPIDAFVSAPFDAFSALLVSLQSSEYRADVLSWLANRYLNPSDLYADEPPYPYTYPNAFKNYGIGNSLALLPPSVVGAIFGVLDGISDRINGVLGDFADPLTGQAVMDAFSNSTVGRLLESARSLPLAPVWALWGVASYAGWLPYNLVTTLEAAVQDPRDIPGLISNLAWGLLGPDGLVGDVIWELSYPLTNLPGLIGQISTQIVDVIFNVLDRVLSILPTPIDPTSFPEARVLEGTTEFEGAAADSIVGTFGAVATNVVTVSEGEAPAPVETEPVAPEAVAPEPVESEPVGSGVEDLEPTAPAPAPVVEDELTDDEEPAGTESAEDELAVDGDSTEPEGSETGTGNPPTSDGDQPEAPEAEGPSAESGSESDSDSDTESGETAAAA